MYKILLIDDKEIFRRKMKRLDYFKTSEDFEITYEAKNGLEAMNLIKSEKIDIVITDIRMPIMDGLEVLRAIKTKNLCRCVILLSEYSDFEYAKEGLIYGAFDFIVKPVDNEKVKKVLDRAKEYLDGCHDVKYYTQYEAEVLGKLILNGDNYASEYAEHIFQPILERQKDPQKIRAVMGEFFDSVVREMVKEKPWLEKFVDFKKLVKTDARKDMMSAADEIIERLLEQIGEFNLPTNKELIIQVGIYVQQHIEEGVSLKSISEKYFVNKEYLSHLFKMETGRNFTDYVTEMKMKYAKRKLDDTNIKIYHIANMLGFRDTEYFSRIFKKYYGCSPSEYRKNRGYEE